MRIQSEINTTCFSSVFLLDFSITPCLGLGKKSGVSFVSCTLALNPSSLPPIWGCSRGRSGQVDARRHSDTYTYDLEVQQGVCNQYPYSEVSGYSIVCE